MCREAIRLSCPLFITKDHQELIVYRRSDGQETVLIRIPETGAQGSKMSYNRQEDLPTRGSQREFSRKYVRPTEDEVKVYGY